jgi:rifampicin phosphotransferase
MIRGTDIPIRNDHFSISEKDSATLDKLAVGEKAYTLIRLAENGFPVPEFRVVPNAYFEDFISRNGLRQRIYSLLAQSNSQDPQSINGTSSEIQRELVDQPLSSALIHDVKAIVKTISGQLMVRSSAVGEDSSDASFAGQLDSFRTNGDSEAVIAAVRKCWASYWSARCLSYQFAQGKSLKGMGVIIQRYVDPVFAGVAFTQSPSNGADEMLIEYCRGFGENLVAGKVTPGRIVVNKETRKYKIQSGNHMLGAIADWGPSIRKLIEVSLKLETLLVGPQDLEWAIGKEGKLYLLQARPITAGGRQQRRIFWSNVNVNENYPNPMTPFLYSIALKSYYYYFRGLARSLGVREKAIRAADPLFSNIIGSHGTRMYYNMTSIHGTIGLLPLGQVFSAYFNDFVGADANENRKSDRSGRRKHSIADKLIFAGKLLFSLLHAPVKVRRFERTADAHLKRFYSHGKLIHQKDLPTLHRRFREFLIIRFFKWNDAAIADLSAMLSYGLLGAFLKRIYSAEEARAKQNLLLQGIPDLVSSISSQKTWELVQLIKKNQPLLNLFSSGVDSQEILARIKETSEFQTFRESLDQYINKWGYRCSGELMLTEANYLEKPGKFIELLQGYLSSESAAPQEIIKAKTAEKKQLIESIRKYLLRRGPGLTGALAIPLLYLLLHWTEKSISFRERVRLKQAMLYGHLRDTLQNLGGVLRERGTINQANEIFFLKYHELLELLSGSEMLSNATGKILQARIAEHRVLSQISLPDSFYLNEGEYLSEKITAPAILRNNTGNTFKGTSACGGIVKGRAKILSSVLEAGKIQPGDILVARQTDPGWALVFPLIAGLVLERGGMLSHGAIVAREFGIPAVVGIKQISSIIQDGMEILVNGENGTIQF